jgi:hypothetical protein
MKSYIKMKSIDIEYFFMKHFNSEFYNDGDIPRQWPSLTV